MVATVAAMVVDMGAMVDMAAVMAAAMAVTAATVATIAAEKHPDMLLTIDTVPNRDIVLLGVLLQKTSNSTWNSPHSGQLKTASLYKGRDGDTVKLHPNL